MVFNKLKSKKVPAKTSACHKSVVKNTTLHQKNKSTRLRGFTMIEVIIFVAISGAIVIGLVGFLTESIHIQRYRDTVNDLAEYLHRVYTNVVNVENGRDSLVGSSRYCSISTMWDNGVLLPPNNDIITYPGRSDCVMYGKVITFDERTDDANQRGQRIYEYDIIGSIYSIKDIKENGVITGSTINQLLNVGADVVTVRPSGNSNYTFDEENEDFVPEEIPLPDNYYELTDEEREAVDQDIERQKEQQKIAYYENASCSMNYAGNWSTYSLQWGGWIEDQTIGSIKKGTIMIVRSPYSGTVETYYLENDAGESMSLGVQDLLEKNNTSVYCKNGPAMSNAFLKYADDFLAGQMKAGHFKQDKDIYLCVNSEERAGRLLGDGSGNREGLRKAVKIARNGSNASAVEVADDADSVRECER